MASRIGKLTIILSNRKPWFFLFLLLFLQLCSSTTSHNLKLKTKTSEIQPFVEKLNSLVQRHFLKCTLVQKSYYDYSFNSKVSQSVISVLVQNKKGEKGDDEKEKKSKAFTYRFSSRCVLPIIFVATSTVNNIDENEWKTPIWDTRFNEDKFIFVLLESQEQNQNPHGFFSHGLLKGIKYKLFLRAENEKWKWTTLSPYKRDKSPYYYNIENTAIVDIKEKGGIFPDKSILFPDYETDLRGKIMRLAIHRLAGRVEVEKVEDGTLRLKRGMYPTASIHAGKHLNFSIEVVPNPDGAPGIRQKNGTWTGAIGDIINGRADFSIPNGVTLSRYTEVEFSHVMETTSLAALSGDQLPIYSWKSVFWPFLPFLWFLIIISTIFSIVSLWSYTIPINITDQALTETDDNEARLESGQGQRSRSNRVHERMALQTPKSIKSTNKSGSNNDEENPGFQGNQWSLDVIIMFMTSILLEQGGPNIPDLMKISCLCWILFTMIITCAYRSKLVTLMTFPVTPKIPDSFEELASSDFRPILLYYGGSEYYLLKTSTKKHLVKIYNEMDKDKNIFNCHIRVIGRKESCITYYQTLDYIKARYLSDSYGRKLHLSHHKEFFIMIGFGWAKGAVFAPNFNKFVDGFVEGGLNNYWLLLDFRELRRQRKIKEKVEGKSMVDQMGLNIIHVEEAEEILSLKHLRGAFFLLSLGLAASFTAFVHEKYKEVIVKLMRRKEGPKKDRSMT